MEWALLLKNFHLKSHPLWRYKYVVYPCSIYGKACQSGVGSGYRRWSGFCLHPELTVLPPPKISTSFKIQMVEAYVTTLPLINEGTYDSVHCWKVETAQMSAGGWTDKWSVASPDNKIVFSLKKGRKYWHVRPHGQALRAACWVKEARHERPQMVWFHLCEMSTKRQKADWWLLGSRVEEMGSDCWWIWDFFLSF